MTLGQAEGLAVDLSRFHAGHIAAAHPFALARMTKLIVKPPDAPPDDSEVLEGVEAPFVLWDHQREVLEAMLRRRRVIVLKARQLGVSWAMALFTLWYAFSHPNANIVVVSIGDREARSFSRKIKFLYDHLPEQVRAAFPSPEPTNETFLVRHTAGDARITSLPSSSSAGRGETVNLLICDEVAHWEDAASRFASLTPTVEDIGQLILASTANGVGDVFHDVWEGAPGNGYVRLFANATARPDRSDEQVRAMRDRVPEGRGPQEYPMSPAEAFLTSGKCAFNIRALQEYLDHRCRPEKLRGNILVDEFMGQVKFVPDEINGLWRVWRWREEGRSYLITGDSCGGVGAVDYAAMAVYDLQSWDQVAAFHGKVEPVDFAHIMIRAGWMWRGPGGPALLAPEANLDGRAVLTILRERGYPNVWTQARYDQNRDDRTVQQGWMTTSGTRPVMLGSLKEMLSEGTLGAVDNLFIGECLTFEVNPKTGKEEAREGKHDDRVMTHAIAAAVLGREASGAAPRDIRPGDLRPYRRPASARTGYHPKFTRGWWT